jgi:hypothetical protein
MVLKSGVGKPEHKFQSKAGFGSPVKSRYVVGAKGRTSMAGYSRNNLFA